MNLTIFTLFLKFVEIIKFLTARTNCQGFINYCKQFRK
jgi:hypothetical protein